MEFTKRSNLGALLAAVLVGLLSLCINHVFRIEPEDVDRFLAKVAETRRKMQTQPIERSPLKLHDDLKQMEKTLNKIFLDQVHGRKLDTDQLSQTVKMLTTSADALENHEHATPEQIEQGRMLAFSGLFLAARMMPDEFSESFRRIGDRILNGDGPRDEQNRVRLLSAFHEFDVSKMQDAVVLKKLKAYSQQQADPSLAIRLYLLLSEEASNQGRLYLARDILLQGVKLYDGHPQKHKMANRLIDLQIESTSPHLFHEIR